ncbi:hypothetical protein [Ramlibacter rhizophilus]|uniref:Uncharacterized protein n=1 Tax=Ramlibacter rhizophilus TaxID=1781167 RepID=A0A4Z0BZV3_9BURK|nr:hypothetical protein [Ramlibacter rhizophilus]TFZ04491.1 hypothetical protein EZ242_01705 [Ramlibacter rhizophilus]
MTFTTQDGIERTPEQIEAAFACCRQLQFAYAMANQGNGGLGRVHWQDVDDALGWASDALTVAESGRIARNAADENGDD